MAGLQGMVGLLALRNWCLAITDLLDEHSFEQSINSTENEEKLHKKQKQHKKANKSNMGEDLFEISLPTILETQKHEHDDQNSTHENDAAVDTPSILEVSNVFFEQCLLCHVLK